MSSALKPALPTGGAQASPAKAVPGAAAAQPPGARVPPLVGQNLTHHQPSAAHAAQSLAHVPMSPVSQNMAQMAQNMSHHGNLSHISQNNGAPALGASNGSPQPSKSAAGAPLSLVQDKCPAGASQPLALTRPTDKKEDTEAEAASAQPNGTVDSSTPAAADSLAPHDADKAKLEASSCPAKSPAKPVEGSASKPAESSPAKPIERSPAKPSEKIPAPALAQLKPDSSSSSQDNQLQVNKLGSSTDVADQTSPTKPKEGKEPTHGAATVPAASAPAAEPKLPDESASAKTSSAQEPSTTQAVVKPDVEPTEPETKTSAKGNTPEKKEAKMEPEKPAESKTVPKDQVDAPVQVKTPLSKKEDQKPPVKKEEQKSPPKKEEPKKPAEAVTPAALKKPAEATSAAPKKSAETVTPAAAAPKKPAEAITSAVPKKSAEAVTPAAAAPKKPAEAMTSAVPKKSAEAVTSAAPKKPAEAVTPAAPKKAEVKTPGAKSTLKLATVTPTARKRRQESKSPAKVMDGPSPAKKPADAETVSTPDSRISKRNRTKVQPYQSPTPELAMATKLSASAGRATPTKPGDDNKLIVFYKNEYLAVRNAEGGFYVCQTMQNVYRSSRKIKIRWLSQDKTLDPSGETYKPDFYDVTDMECVLTTLSMSRAGGGGGAQVLSGAEAARARSILERALSAEQSGRPANIQLTEEHPDGLDLSLYTDESQLEKKKKVSRKRNSSKSSLDKSSEAETAQKEDDARPTPSKRAKPTPKKSPKSAPKVAKSAPKTPNNNNKRKSAPGSTPIVANKTALVPTKATPAKTPAKKAKTTPVKKTPAKAAKVEPPAKAAPPARAPPAAAKTATPAKATPPAPKGKTPRKSDKEAKIAQLAATPSTSTGKTTRTPRKPPSKKRRSSANNFILR